MTDDEGTRSFPAEATEMLAKTSLSQPWGQNLVWVPLLTYNLLDI